MASEIHFGTGGWRAIIADDFNKENICRFGQGVANMIIAEGKQDKPVIIGYDRRFLSDDASRWLAQVLCANSIHVHLMKRSSPTPLVMFSVKDENLHFGLEVTASHNPPTFNGIKLIIHEGRDADVAITEKLDKSINSVQQVKFIELTEAEQTGLLSYIKNPFNRYIDNILDNLDVEKIKNRGLRIAFDPMHGSGTYPLLVVLFTARCTVDMINQNKDAYFGKAMPAPTKETLHELETLVVREKYDLGIAFDGDGDRIGIIDPTGEFIDANSILLMLYWYLHEYKGWKGPVVRNNSTTHLLDKMAHSFNEECYEVPVGFKWVSAKIDETNAVLGGESSGGLTVRGHIFGKDSIYAASLIVEMISVTGMTPCEILKKIHQQYGMTAFRDISMKFTHEQKAKIIKTLMEDHIIPDFEHFNIDHISYQDGCKIYFTDDSFVICRFSGTEPIVRITAEAWFDYSADKYVELFKDFINSCK